MNPKEHVIRVRAEREYGEGNDEAFASNDALWLLRVLDNAREIARLAEESEAGWRRDADELAEKVREAEAERLTMERDRNGAQVRAERAEEQLADLREQVAAHVEERDQALAEVADLTAERDNASALARRWAHESVGKSRTVAAQGEVIERVRAALNWWHASDDIAVATTLLVSRLEGTLAALDAITAAAPTPPDAWTGPHSWTPDEPCPCGQSTCPATPPTTDAQEATEA